MFATIYWIVNRHHTSYVALSALVCWRCSRMVREIRSLRSLQGEIADIDACVASLITTIRRMEGRQTARLGRSSTQD